MQSNYSLSIKSDVIVIRSTPSYNVTLPLSDHQHYRCLIASEVVHLMCLVPIFFDFLQNNKGKKSYFNCLSIVHVIVGVLEMIAVATNNRNISDNISHIARKIQNFGVMYLLLCPDVHFCLRVMFGTCIMR